MAKTLYTGNTTVTTIGGGNGYKFEAEVIENSTNTANNTSNVTCNLYCTGLNGYYYTNHSASYAYINIDGTRMQTTSVPNTSTSKQLICTWNDNITHDSDGTKTIRVTFNYTNGGSSDYYMPNDAKITAASVTLTTIPRYTSITTFAANKRDDSSLAINWGTADTIDYVWYRYKKLATSSYSSWIGVDVTDGTSGSFNVSGLNDNTTYNFQLRVRRKDSQLTTDSTSDATQTTYQTPTQSFNTKTETSVTMNWSCDVTCDYLWYSKDNGANWVAVGSVNASSGSYTISGLSPATSYAIKTRIRRTATQITDDTSSMSATTLAVPIFSLKSKTETSFSIDWNADSTIDYVWYSTNNGSNYTGLDVTDGTSGNFTISGLSAITDYNVRMKFRRKATQTVYEVASQQFQTYDYPHITNVGSNPLTIGNSQALTLYNPIPRNVTIKMYKDNTNGTELYSGTTSGISATITPNANTLYSSIPNDTEGDCVYSVKYGNVTKTTEVKKYQIKGDEYPTFAANNFSYTANKTELTNNNQLAIDKYATLSISIDTEATSNYGTTIDKYVVKWGSATATISNGTTGTITGGSGNTLIVTAYDKRGLPKETQKTITNFAYADIDISNISTPRTNGVEAEVKLNITGRLYNGKFGTDGVNNALYSAKYWTSTNQTFSGNGYSIPISNFNVSNGIFSLSNYNIHSNGSSGGFTIGTPYYVKVEIKDAQGLLASVIKTSNIADGKISRSVFKTSDGNYHQGINGLPSTSYTDVVHGTLNVTNQIYKNGTPLATVATSGSYNDLSNKPTNIQVTRGASTSTKQYGYWASMCRSDQTGSPALPSTQKWWHVISMDWSNSYTAWISQLALPTNDGGVPHYRRNNSSGTDIDSSTWHRFVTDEQIKSATSVSHSNYGTNNGYVPDMSFIAYWNGAYNSNNASNLKFCSGGYIAYYYVGSIIETYTSTNPSTYFGGTWQRYGTGRVTVDLDTSDGNFNTIGKTGGANSNSYTPGGTIGGTAITVDQMPKHQHDVGNSHSSGETYSWTPYMIGNVGSNKGWRTNVMTNYAGGGKTHTHSWTGTAQSVSTLQKYITVYRWRRTA